MSIITLKHIPTKDLFPTAMDSGYGQSSVNACDLSNNDAEYRMRKAVVESTPTPSNRAVR
jgi:hypothetical protein